MKVLRNDLSGVYSLAIAGDLRVYTGRSKNLRLRIANHKSKLKKGIHENKEMQEAFNKNPYMMYQIVGYHEGEEAEKLELWLIEQSTGWCYNVNDKANKGERPYHQVRKQKEVKKSVWQIGYKKDPGLKVKWESAGRAAVELGISKSSIWKVLQGHRKSAGGYKWSYKI